MRRHSRTHHLPSPERKSSWRIHPRSFRPNPRGAAAPSVRLRPPLRSRRHAVGARPMVPPASAGPATEKALADRTAAAERPGRSRASPHSACVDRRCGFPGSHSTLEWRAANARRAGGPGGGTAARIDPCSSRLPPHGGRSSALRHYAVARRSTWTSFRGTAWFRDSTAEIRKQWAESGGRTAIVRTWTAMSGKLTAVSGKGAVMSFKHCAGAQRDVGSERTIRPVPPKYP